MHMGIVKNKAAGAVIANKVLIVSKYFISSKIFNLAIKYAIRV